MHDCSSIEEITVEGSEIRLDQFLKWVGAVSSGGAVKPLIAAGRIFRNGEKERARRRKLFAGDIVELRGVGAWKLSFTQP